MKTQINALTEWNYSMEAIGGQLRGAILQLTMFRKYFVLLALCSTFFAAQAQRDETLLDHSGIRGAFVAPIVEWGLSDGVATSAGAGAALVVGQAFVGAYGLGSTDFQHFYQTGQIESIRLAHGGLWIGGSVPSHKLIHLYGSARIGWGALDIDTNDNFHHYSDLDKVFVATPELGLELNLTRWLRIGAAAGYRYVSGVNHGQIFDDSDLRGYTMSLAVRVGWFGSRRSDDRW